MISRQAHVQPWKIELVDKISKELLRYNTIAVINLENLPSRQCQLIRAKIKHNTKFIIAKKRLIKLAFEKSGKEELKQLTEYLIGMPALILTNQNAFELFKTLKDNMRLAPARAGQMAPEDIWVKEGSTPFSPGPIIGELGAVGITAGIEGGKVVIKKDCLVVKAGERISAAAANILARLDIKPMKIGLNLVAAVENGELFDRSILDIDIDKYIKTLKTAVLDAKKLAISANILIPEIATIKLKEAYFNAIKLAIGAEILCDETKEHLLIKAELQASNLKKLIQEKEKQETKSLQSLDTSKNKTQSEDNQGG